MIIDPHVHLRDWEQAGKETLSHGLETAALCGLAALFDMPNTQPTLTSREAVLRRLSDADAAREGLETEGKGSPFYGLYAGITPDPRQIEEMVVLQRELFPRVVGLKLFAGRSTGNLAIVEEERQRLVWKTLSESGYQGLVAIHCEKEALFRPELWDPERPATHGDARPEVAEQRSIEDQLAFAGDAGFSGKLHVCHISSVQGLAMVERARREGRVDVSCGATPHHLLLDRSMIPEGREGLLYKVNPPLRAPETRVVLLEALLDGRIDWIESDHAPHRPEDKYESYASGIPSLVAWPRLIKALRLRGASDERIAELAGKAVLRRFGIDRYRDSIIGGDEGRAAETSSPTSEELSARYEANCWSIRPRYLDGR